MRKSNKKQSPQSDEILRSKTRVLLGEPPSENATIGHLRKKSLLALSLLMAGSLAATACGSNEEGRATSDPAITGTASAATGTPSAAASKPVKLTFYNSLGYRQTTPMPALDKDPIRQMIQKDNNIELETILGGENWRDKLNVLISSNQIPDIIGFPDRASAVKYYDQGLLADLDDLMKNTPELAGAFDASRWEPMKYKGKTIGVPGVEPVGGVNGWWINNDWLKKLNLQVPATAEELLKVMKAFTFDDPDGNGKNDTYGFVGMLPKDGSLGVSSSGGGGNGFQQIFWMFGVQPNYIDVKDGKVFSHNTDPRMKEALTFIRAMLEAKVVDPDWVTIDDGLKRDQKMYQGKVGIMIEDWRRMEPADQKKMKDIGGSTPDWIQIAPPKGPHGDQILDTKAFQSSLWGISKEALKDTEKAKRAMALLQYFYTNKEAYKTLSYGLKGQTWNEIDGKPKLVDKSTYNEKEVEWRYNYAFVRKANDSVYFDFQKPELTNANQKLNNSFLRDNSIHPRVFDDANDTLAQDRIKYINSTMLAFITGKEPLDNFDSFVKTLQDKFKQNDALQNYTKQLQAEGVLK
ncbi:MAG: hypothetical protein K0R57_5542 [Paenibacillaceae bacterium]|jgi:putative aldouronate transport system substrate-binding protein|nr:hypothetical protein [Paenibacillaceae bacterium]